MLTLPVTFISVMAMKPYFLKHVVTAFVVASIFVTPVAAQQSEETLLQELSEAGETDALRLDRALSLIWDNSGSPSMNLLLKRGRDALKEEDTRTAIDHLTALTDHAPGFAEGWHARATAYYQAGLYGPALDDLERALALNPNNYNAIFGLGVMLREFGDLDRAAQAFERVLALHPNHENAKAAQEQLKRSGIGRTL